MKKIALIFTIFCILFLGCNSQEINDKAILYEISGNGLDKPSYLFGTMHSVPKDRFSIPKIVEEKLLEIKTLVLEIDVDIPLKEQIAMAQKIIIPENKTLKDYMHIEEYNEIYSYFVDSLGVAEKKTERYMHIKPFFLMGIILQEYFGKVESYEMEFSKIAKKENKGFSPLETIDFQLNLLDTISIETQMESYENSDIIGEYNKMLDIYLQADIDGLYDFISKSGGYEKMEEELMITRNKNWIPKIENLLNESTLFIAVGAGHLPGKLGVINLLKKEGYTVKKLNTQTLSNL